MITNRALKILFLLQSNEYYSSQELADYLCLSVRTIKYEMAQFFFIKQFGFEVISIKGKGYKLVITDKEKYSQFNKDNLSQYGDIREILDEIEDRIQQAVKLILVCDDWITTQQLADELFIDRRTLSNNLSKIKEQLNMYHLNYVTKPKKGGFLYGDEIHKRIALVDLLKNYNKVQPIYPKNSFFQQFDIPAKVRLEVRRLFLMFLREHQIFIKDLYSQKFIFHIIICYQREKANHPVFISKEVKQKYTSLEIYQYMKEFILNIDSIMNYDLDENSILYLTIIILSYLDVHPNFNFTKYSYLKNECDTRVAIIFDRLTHPIFDGIKTDEFMRSFSNNFFATSIKISNQIQENSQWYFHWRYKQISSKILSVSFAQIVSNIIYKEFEYICSYEDIMTIAYSFSNYISKEKFPYQKRKIIIYSNDGYNSIEYAIEKLNENFGQFIASIDIVERYFLNDSDYLKNRDVLIANQDYGIELEKYITFFPLEKVIYLDYNAIYSEVFLGGIVRDNLRIQIEKHCLKESDMEGIIKKMSAIVQLPIHEVTKFITQRKIIVPSSIIKKVFVIVKFSKNENMQWFHLDKTVKYESLYVQDIVWLQIGSPCNLFKMRWLEMFIHEIIYDQNFRENYMNDKFNDLTLAVLQSHFGKWKNN